MGIYSLSLISFPFPLALERIPDARAEVEAVD